MVTTTTKNFNSFVIVGAETSYASGGSPSAAIGRVRSFSPTWSQKYIRNRGLGEGRNESETIYGNFDASFSVDLDVTDATWDFMAYLIGPRSGSGTSASPYALTERDYIGYDSNDIKTFAMEVSSENGTTDDVDTYSGCSLQSATISAAVGGILSCSASGVAKTLASTTSASSYTAETTDPWTFQQGTFKWGSTPTTVGRVNRFSVTINQGLQVYRSFASRFIEQPEAGNRTYDFTIECTMTTTLLTTLRDDFYGQASSPHAGLTSSTAVANNEIELNVTRSEEHTFE